jgi:hypothetical protein
MRSLLLIGASALLLAPFATIRAAEPVPLTRTGKWQVNYDPDSCSLFAEFGTGDQAALLKFTQFAPGDFFDLTLFGKMFRSDGLFRGVEIGFQPASPLVHREAILGKAGEGSIPIMMVSQLRLDDMIIKKTSKQPAKVTPATEATASGLTLRLSGGRRYRFETGSFTAPMASMRSCLTDLIKHWGYDPAILATLAHLPTPLGKQQTWLRSNDYPLTALYHGRSGLVQFRLDVDEAGAVAGCRVLYRTDPDEFADITCRNLTKRAKFEPAVDQQGKPAKAFYIGSVRWMARH